MSIMDMHAMAGAAVLLVLIAVSAYRDALRNDTLGPRTSSNKGGSHRPPASKLEKAD